MRKHNKLPINWKEMFKFDLSYADQLLRMKSKWSIKWPSKETTENEYE